MRLPDPLLSVIDSSTYSVQVGLQQQLRLPQLKGVHSNKRNP